MNDDQTPNADPAPDAARPKNWDRDEMRPDSAEPDAAPTDEGDDVPRWNEGQMTGQHADGTRTKGPTDEEIASSAGGLSGGGANPGGGERWAERDDEPAED